MQFPRRPDYKTVATTWAHGTTYQLPISREFWLESAWIGVHFTAAAVAPTSPTAEGFANLVKNVRMSVTDATGNRKVVDMTGSAIQEYARQVIGGVDRNSTLLCYPTSAGVFATPAAQAYVLWFPIFFRDPLLEDPMGAATMLALPRLTSDPTLEITIGAAADIASNTASVITTPGRLVVALNRRDVLVPNFPTIPCELITYERAWHSAGGKQDWEIPPIGTVTRILIQDFVGGTANGGLRKTVLGSGSTSDEIGQDWSLEYLSTVIRRSPPNFIMSENDVANELYPATWNNPLGSYLWDFLTDYPPAGAFSLGSCLDLNPLSLNGGKARIIGSSLVTTANSITRFTVHKMYGDLRAVKFV